MSIASSARISGGRWTFKKGGEPRPCHLGSTYQHKDSTNCRLLRAHDLRSHRRAPKRRDELRRINWSKWIWIGRRVLQIGRISNLKRSVRGYLSLQPSVGRRRAADRGSALRCLSSPPR
jgi:hypothetical protein